MLYCPVFLCVQLINLLSLPTPQPELLLPAVAPADPVATATPQDVPPTLPPAPADPAPADPAPADPASSPALAADGTGGLSPAPPQLLPAPLPRAKPAQTPARPTRRRRRGSRGSSPARRGARAAAAKRRGRPPNSVFQELEQQYFTQLVVKPIPACK